ncbi:MAG: hypothetical protein AB1393_13545 [Candidatus Edwardsbacteria bacterium]
MKSFSRFERIDRRLIFSLMALAVIIPMLSGIKFPAVDVSEPARNAFLAVDRLPPGSAIILSIDYDASSMPEVHPMLLAVLRHAFKKNLKVILLGHWPTGMPLGTLGLEMVAKEFNKKYGEDYVNLGYRPGTVSVMVGLGKEIRDFFKSDVNGTPLDSLKMMQKIHNYNDIRLLAGLEAGDTIEFWIIYAQARFGLKMIIGTTAVMAPLAYPYLQSKQLQGLLGGLKGAAEYETLLKNPSIGVLGMFSQSVGHLLILLFILLGNLGYFLTRKKP